MLKGRSNLCNGHGKHMQAVLRTSTNFSTAQIPLRNCKRICKPCSQTTSLLRAILRTRRHRPILYKTSILQPLRTRRHNPCQQKTSILQAPLRKSYLRASLRTRTHDPSQQEISILRAILRRMHSLKSVDSPSSQLPYRPSSTSFIHWKALGYSQNVCLWTRK